MVKLSRSLLECGISLNEYTKKDGALTLVLGTLISRDDLTLSEKIADSSFIYFSCMEDPVLHVKAKFFSKYEVGTEEGILGVLLTELATDKKLDENEQAFLDELDEGYLSAECNVGEEEAQEVVNLLENNSLTLVLGADLEFHPKAQNIANLIALLSKLIDVEVVIANVKAEKSSNTVEVNLEDIDELATFDGTVVYCCPAKEENENQMLFGSAQFGVAAKSADGQKVVVQTKTDRYERTFKIDSNLKGTVALLPLDEEIFSYRYGQSKITQVG